MAVLSSATQAVIQTIFPPVCVVCGHPPAGGAYLCTDCEIDLDLLRAQPACPRCGRSPGPFLSLEGHCSACNSRQSRFNGTARVAPYVEPMVTLVQQFKFHRREYLDRYLATLMATCLEQAAWRDEIEALVPVPSHWTRRFRGGFYLVGALASQVARRANLPCLPVVRRIKFERHQIGLSLPERVRNVAGAFGIRRGAELEDACVCVIDDVMTSGATLDEVAKVLKNAGAKKVYNLTLARAGPQDSNMEIDMMRSAAQ